MAGHLDARGGPAFRLAPAIPPSTTFSSTPLQPLSRTSLLVATKGPAMTQSPAAPYAGGFPPPPPGYPGQGPTNQGQPGPFTQGPFTQGPMPQGQPGPMPQGPPQGPSNQPAPGPYGPPAGWTGEPAKSKVWLLAGLLQVLAVVLVPLGASLPFGENFSSSAMWSTATTWASFATLAAVVQLAPFIGRSAGWAAATSWKVGAVAVGGLIGFWVLIVLPGISTGQNFTISMGVFAAAIGLWLSPGRQL